MSRLSRLRNRGDLERRVKSIRRSVEKDDGAKVRVPQTPDEGPGGRPGREIRVPDPPDDEGPPPSPDPRPVQLTPAEQDVKNRMSEARSVLREGFRNDDLKTVYRAIDIINLEYAEYGDPAFNNLFEQAFDTIERAVNNEALGNLEQAINLMQQGINQIGKNTELPDPIDDDPVDDPVQLPTPRPVPVERREQVDGNPIRAPRRL